MESTTVVPRAAATARRQLTTTCAEERRTMRPMESRLKPEEPPRDAACTHNCGRRARAPYAPCRSRGPARRGRARLAVRAVPRGRACRLLLLAVRQDADVHVHAPACVCHLDPEVPRGLKN